MAALAADAATVGHFHGDQMAVALNKGKETYINLTFSFLAHLERFSQKNGGIKTT